MAGNLFLEIPLRWLAIDLSNDCPFEISDVSNAGIGTDELGSFAVDGILRKERDRHRGNNGAIGSLCFLDRQPEFRSGNG